MRACLPGGAARAALVLAASAALLQGCAGRTLYRWGEYDEALYAHYKNPQDREAFVERLRVVIDGAEQAGEKVPPGCYAEYGYALYEEARYEDASRYFKLEREKWPESGVLMQKMIGLADRRGGKAPAAPAAAAAVPAKPVPVKATKAAAKPAATRGPAGALERR
ncbi:DUF4810 domain-containing protein [Anaeromyxobacter sp. PSR-1]|uniref:DUF4810 domain-containing protein n=1 Tax=unclassified Anaeromyxobacter TaxID=2620896 RepID=UPI0005DC0FA9|nr:DUF4810 domain-containing protein [Anaeromyxobacter sp. PSR-1]GAO04409.1 hypothetical protein PSR1_03303 [Anaeromyxobacter sp. PSR-1]